MAGEIPKVTSSEGNEKAGTEIKRKRKRKANLYMIGS
jgi:hypothetical protein